MLSASDSCTEDRSSDSNLSARAPSSLAVPNGIALLLTRLFISFSDVSSFYQIKFNKIYY